jgi:hypothetical protein
MNFLGGSSLTLDAVHNNPDWGGGLLCLLRVLKASVVKEGEAIGAWALNTWSNLFGETPPAHCGTVSRLPSPYTYENPNAIALNALRSRHNGQRYVL